MVVIGYAQAVNLRYGVFIKREFVPSEKNKMEEAIPLGLNLPSCHYKSTKTARSMFLGVQGNKERLGFTSSLRVLRLNVRVLGRKGGRKGGREEGRKGGREGGRGRRRDLLATQI